MKLGVAKNHFFFCAILFLLSQYSHAQGLPNSLNAAASSSGERGDSLQHRVYDTVDIFYKEFNSIQIERIDSSIGDITKKIPVPYTINNLGNMGTATQSLVFQPIMRAGWDMGFHAYDFYNYTPEHTKFYQTTKPYTDIAYIGGGQQELAIHALHTQNQTDAVNFSIEYKFLNSPGLYRSQNTNDNVIRGTLHIRSKNKRYESFLILISNKNISAENGGIVDPSQIAALSGSLNDVFSLPTRMGARGTSYPSPFSATINVGNTYKNLNFVYQHQYDFGQRDSIVEDTVVTQLFYPRFRIQHQIQYFSNNVNFKDNIVDSLAYQSYFGYRVNNAKDSLSITDNWSGISNELNFISFPQKDNLGQYLKLGAGINNFSSTYTNPNVRGESYYNLYLSGEYRNRTKNRVWDMAVSGQLYVSGLNTGDYLASLNLQRILPKLGTLQIGIQNVNRTPSAVYMGMTSFDVKQKSSFNKENTTHFFGMYSNKSIGLTLTGDYYILANHSYFDSFYSVKQATAFTMLHIGLEKKFHLAKYINWYIEGHLQQATGDAPVRVPLLLTRNRLAFEGNFFKKLDISTGLEARYFTPYDSYGYSPMLGQFVYQSTNRINNKPDVNAYFNLRIRSFRLYVRAENLNAFDVQGLAKGYFQFTQPNQVGTYYYAQTFWLHVGIFWSFVN